MSDKVWFIFRGKHHIGPFSEEEIAAKYYGKEITSRSTLWRRGQKDWLPLEKISDFAFLSGGETHAKKESTAHKLPPPLPKEPTSQAKVVTKIRIGSKPEVVPRKEQGKEKGEARTSPAAYRLVRCLEVAAGLAVCYLLTFLVWNFVINPKPEIVGVSAKGRDYLEQVSNMPSEYGAFFRLVPTADGSSLWLSSNFDRQAEVFITITPRQGRVLGRANNIIRSQAKLARGFAHFSFLELSTGQGLAPGEYEVDLHGYVTGVEDKLRRFVSQLGWLSNYNREFSWKGNLVYAPKGPERLERDLKVHVLRLAKKVAPLKERLQQYKTFKAQLDTIISLKNEAYKKSAQKGGQIFEREYGKKIGPLLSALVADTSVRGQKEGQANLGEYKKLATLGKEIGSLAAQIAAGKKAVEKLAAHLTDKTHRHILALEKQIARLSKP